MFGGSFRVARVFGIDIQIHPSWLLILVFIAWTLADGVFPDQYDGWSTAAYWIVGSISAVLLFVTVLIHELAHAIVAKRRGLEVPKITLFIFGGVSHLSRQPKTAGEEFAIAAAGPATSFVIAAVCAGIAYAVKDGNEKVLATFAYLATINILLGVFNLVPGFPLDGGRVLRSIAWHRTQSFRRATRVAAGVGEMIAYLLMVGGLFFLLAGFIWNGVWFLFIGWFLLGAAKAESSQMQLDTILGRLRAKSLMHQEFVSVPPGASVQQVVDNYMVPNGERAVMVANDGVVAGIITVSDVRHLPREEWEHTPAQRVMTPRAKVITVGAETPAIDVLHLLGERRLNQVPVLEEGRMIGLITRRELLDRVQLAETLSTERDTGDDGASPAPPASPPEQHPPTDGSGSA